MWSAAAALATLSPQLSTCLRLRVARAKNKMDPFAWSRWGGGGRRGRRDVARAGRVILPSYPFFKSLSALGKGWIEPMIVWVTA